MVEEYVTEEELEDVKEENEGMTEEWLEDDDEEDYVDNANDNDSYFLLVNDNDVVETEDVKADHDEDNIFCEEEVKTETEDLIVQLAKNDNLSDISGFKLVLNENLSQSNQTKSSCCPICFKKLNRVDEHIRLFHCNKAYVCMNCNNSFLTVKNLKSHQLKCLNVVKEYKCNLCMKEFHRKSNYKAHIKRHSVVKEFKCEECGKSFVDSTGLKRHYLKHHEPSHEIYISNCCKKLFKSKEGMKKHIVRNVCSNSNNINIIFS